MKLGNHVKARVYAGAAFLDAMIGTKWRKKIDPERLALEDGEACVLGQVYGEYSNGADQLGLEDSQASALGFYEDLDSSYPELTAEWKQLLKQRNAAPKRKRRHARHA